MWLAKDVYYVSDSTAILTEDMGKSLLCQFHKISFNEEKIPFVRTSNDAKKALKHIRDQSGAIRPLIFCTIMDEKIRSIFDVAEVELFDLYGGFLDRLELALEAKALREPGFFRHIDTTKIDKRVEAIHYSMQHDDGTKTGEYDQADIVFVGVSRSGKTPVSVYIATHMGLKAANFPLTADHLNNYEMHNDIVKNRKKVVGLTVSPQHLHRIREKRYSGSKYASLATCTTELQQAGQLFMQHGIQVLNTEGKSIEELAVQATQLLGISKKKWRKV
ncbi:MAG: pyruvate, phosphate dikinase/phosphoenolpyruvate synthase regulator [Desulfobulbaceae bacterium]|nr:pyruvate, phosphate dikinase/phosphoenolpyruvate synthase regulator [Desulfobulbaceae bacterium]